MERPIPRLILLTTVCLTGVVLWTDVLPLGVPGEWTWARVAIGPEAAAGVLLASLAGLVYIGFVVLGARRINRAVPVERAAWLAAAVLLAFAWLLCVLDSAPPPRGYDRVPLVLYYPRSSGYFWQARYDVDDTAAFLAGYEELLAERDFLHIGTHPPGLTLGYLGLWHLCAALPSVRDILLTTRPVTVQEASDIIRSQPVLAAEPFGPTDAACLWLAALLTQAAAVLTLLAVYKLVRRHEDCRTAWLTACLWPLIPAVTVFFPKSDVLYALPATTAAWLWLSACDRQSLPRALAAGVVLWVGMLLSLAFVTVMALLGVMTIWETWTRRLAAESRAFLTRRLVVVGALGFGLPAVLFSVLLDINLLNVWSWNLANHALFYDHNPRTWWLWLLANPLELSLAVGLPVSCAALISLARLTQSAGWRTPRASAAAAFLCVWGLLWLSGKNMGEAARLWILLMPWLLLMVAEILRPAAETDRPTERHTAHVAWMLLSQWLVGLMTIMTIDGFHFAELLAR